MHQDLPLAVKAVTANNPEAVKAVAQALEGPAFTGKTAQAIEAAKKAGIPIKVLHLQSRDEEGRQIVSSLPLADYFLAAAAKPDQYPEVDQRATKYVPINEMFNQEPVNLHNHNDWMYWKPLAGRRRGHDGELEREGEKQPLGTRLRSFIVSL